MKQLLGLAAAVLVALLVAGCGGFAPVPVIDTFSTSAGSVDTGESFDLTVTGSTLGAGEASTTDYSGTLTVSSSPAGYVDDVAINGDFNETFTVTMSAADSYTFTATLEASDGAIATATESVTVNQAWTLPSRYTEVTNASFVRGSISSSTDVDWYRKASVDTSTYYLHWFDDYGASGDLSTVVDVYVTVYDENGTVLASRDDVSPSTSVSGAGQDYLYIKVEPYSTSTGGYYLAVNTSSTVPIRGTITENGGESDNYLSSDEIEVWSYSPSTSRDVIFQWADSYRNYVSASGQLTVDVEVSGWEGVNDPLFFRDDDLSSSADDQTHYVSSTQTAYVIVEDSLGGSGYYDVDVD